ncbi:mitochondrial transcription rescue factor 1 isoform 1-T2 [Discoglossus pictus]
MTGVRLSISAFRNLQSHFRLCSSTNVIKHHTNWTQCRLLSHCLDHHTVPVHGFPHTRRSGLLRLQAGNISVYPYRLKSKKTQNKSSKGSSEEEEEDAAVVSDYEDGLQEDTNVPKDYKDLEKAVQSFRYDVILTAGLDISRNKVEDAFYNSFLRLNGEKLWKKSRAVKVGDTLDLIIAQDKESETTTVMRVILKSVSEEKTQTEKYKVLLRRWKNLQLEKQDVLK